MSSRRADESRKLANLGGVLLLLVAAALPAIAQYQGQVTKNSKDAPELRSIAVLEWTGDEGSPKASRLVPVAVLDAGQLQDGSVYLARPEPLALFPEVEYELQQDGQPIGLYDIKNAGQQLGSWVGFGAWKPMPSARPKPSAAALAKTNLDDDTQSDEPVLHRKRHSDDAPSGSGKSSGGGTDSSSQAQPSDPDRPVLHKKTPGAGPDDTAAAPASGNAGSTTTSDPGTVSDADRPVLHKKDSSTDTAANDSGTSSSSSDDPDRPTLKRGKKSPPADSASVDSAADDSDPDRPRLKRGRPGGSEIVIVPSLKGLPPDAQQTVAVSDARSRPAHPWDYSWSNPEDQARMKASLEDTARDALGLNPPPSKPAVRRTTTRKPTKPVQPPVPAPLIGEQFRVFELAYGSGATLVLSAHTGGAPEQQKFVTLIAQPDLYGNVLVLRKSVTDGSHLDDNPRMRLVDAVDALADNRGELLFELRGATQRQFALYRVLRGQAEQLFVTGSGLFGAENSE